MRNKKPLQLTTSAHQLTGKQEQAIAALLTYPTVLEAAGKIGVTPRTLWNWLNVPLFKERYEAERAALLIEVRTGYTALARKALEGIETLMNGEKTPAAVKLRAYLSILERVIPQDQGNTGQPGSQDFEGDLLSYLNDDEIERLDALLSSAEARKREATPAEGV